eukprot:scaffold36788_cov90-Phaeocystis_antarctica.AAC.2
MSSSAWRKSLGAVYSRGLPCSAAWCSVARPSGGSRACSATSDALCTVSGSPACAPSVVMTETAPGCCSSASRWKCSRSGRRAHARTLDIVRSAAGSPPKELPRLTNTMCTGLVYMEARSLSISVTQSPGRSRQI